MVGKTISHYRIVEKLGEGGMGVVYKAGDARIDRTVALKFLSSHLPASDEARERFVREANAAGTVAAPLRAGRRTIAALIATFTLVVESFRAEPTDGGSHDMETGGWE